MESCDSANYNGGFTFYHRTIFDNVLAIFAVIFYHRAFIEPLIPSASGKFSKFDFWAL